METFAIHRNYSSCAERRFFLIYLIHKRVTFNSGLSFYIVSGSITAGEMVAIIGPRYTFDIYSVKYLT